jgi:hypothetical protein
MRMRCFNHQNNLSLCVYIRNLMYDIMKLTAKTDWTWGKNATCFWCFDAIFPPPRVACARFPSNGATRYKIRWHHSNVTIAWKSWIHWQTLSYNLFHVSFNQKWRCTSILFQTLSVSMLLRYSHHQIFMFIGKSALKEWPKAPTVIGSSDTYVLFNSLCRAQ